MTSPADQPSAAGAEDLDRLCVNTMRTLAMDVAQAAQSGHPGTSMALAPVAYCLWQRFLRFDPADPIWPNRDRFILSNGHGSLLLYVILHLAGVRAVNPEYEVTGAPAVSLEDLRNFRRPGSHAPGHPEYPWSSGVEVTAGPQGPATSVGIAAASRWLGERYKTRFASLFDYDVYVLAGDGDMLEGITGDAASLAGHLALPNLCWIYDNNHVSIEGRPSAASSEEVAARFQSCGWNVAHVGDATDLGLLTRAFESFKATRDKPTLIIADTHAGPGVPGGPENARFLVPGQVYEHFQDGIGARGAKARADWHGGFEEYAHLEPAQAAEISRMRDRESPEGSDSGLVLNVLARNARVIQAARKQAARWRRAGQ